MSLVEHERKKYQSIWKREEYQELSPGMDVIHWVQRKHLKMPEGSTAYDFGCGEGDVVDYLNDRDISTTGIDIVKLRDETVEASLWELPETLKPRDYGLCFHVLEHVPTEKVSESLAGISRLVTQEAFFTIALQEDELGDLIGKRLHLTVKPIGWWRNELTKHFGGVRIGQPDGTFWMWAHVRK